MLLTIIVCTALIFTDQIIKGIVSGLLAPNGWMPVLPGIVELRYLENDGAAFSLLAGKQGVLIAITGIALLVGAYILLFRRPKDRMEYIAIVMIFSGGVGNLIDRIVNGYVVDYINLLFMRFAVFNFADCLVCVGFVFLVVAVFRLEHQAQKKARAEIALREEGAASGERSVALTTSEVEAGTGDAATGHGDGQG